VLSTGLLPQWLIGSEGRWYEINGLGAVGNRESAHRVPTWDSPNTDRMRLRRDFAEPRASRNAVVLGGTTLSVCDYSDQIVHGFRDMYRLLLDRRAALIEPDSPLAVLRRQHVRFIFRPTTSYVRLLATTLDPANLRDGADRAIAFDALSRIVLSNRADHVLWNLRQREQHALEQMDIPCFLVPADSADLPLGANETLTGCFTESAIGLATSRLESLSEIDLERQVAFIRTALCMRAAHDEGSSTYEKPATIESQADRAVPLQPDELLQRALAIAEDLDRRAIRRRRAVCPGSACGRARTTGFGCSRLAPRSTTALAESQCFSPRWIMSAASLVGASSP
jgi:lantibiotic modifying enzyme